MHLAARHPGARALALAAQRLGPQRRLSEDLRRDVAHAREVAADRRGHGDPGHLPVLLHARDVCRAARRTSMRWWTSCAAAPPSRWTRSWPRARRPSRTTSSAVLGDDRRSRAHHLRSARPRLLHALRRAAHERDRAQRAGRLRSPAPRRPARGPRDLQPHDARLPAPPARAALTSGVRRASENRSPCSTMSASRSPTSPAPPRSTTRSSTRSAGGGSSTRPTPSATASTTRGCGSSPAAAGRRPASATSPSPPAAAPPSTPPTRPRSRRAAPTTARPARATTYGPRYYSAYLLDPDGLRVEVVTGSH